MFNFTDSSIFMAILTTNLFILIVSLILQSQTRLWKFGFPLLHLLCILIFVRMLLPFEFTCISKNINLPSSISKINSFFQYQSFPLDAHIWSIWDFLVLIWGIVFFILCLRFFLSIRATHQYILTYGIDATDQPLCQTLLHDICHKKKLLNRLSFIKLPLLQTPAVFQYHRHYYILLPDTIPFDKNELELIFRHELSHILHHDLTMKFFLQIVCFFYWWNPFCSIFQKQSDLLFEFRIDSSVTSGSPDKTARYLSCLLKLAEYNASSKSPPLPSAITFSSQHSSALYKRFCCLTETEKKKSRKITVFLALLLWILFFLSFRYIFECFYISPENAAGSETLTSKNIFVVRTENNTYDIYFHGKFAETTDSLEYYPDNCKIYSSLEEAQKYEK